MELLNQYGSLLIIITAIFGFFMAFGVGANDVSNAMGTSVGSGAVTAKQAIFIAIIFEATGAYLAGGEVTETIKSGIIDTMEFVNEPEVLVFGMMAALFASGAWLLIASKMGWPVSTTHSIIGAVIGFACVTAGPHSVDWSNIRNIVGSWFVTPVIAGVLAYAIFISTQKLIFDTENPLKNAQKYGPYYMSITIFILCIVTLTKGLKHVGLNLSSQENFLISFIISAVAVIYCYFYFRSKKFKQRMLYGGTFSGVEKIFSILMLMTACAMAFAHGSNDVANAIGPLSAVVAIIKSGGQIANNTPLAWWILPLGASGIMVGLIVMGYKVMATIGTGITDLTPSRGFAAQFATAMTVVVASGTGLPISTTQTLVGAVLGIGFARGIAAINLTVIRNIVVSWVVTLPAGALFSIIIYYLLKAIFH
ncbi:inorganic phosphate transporter [Aggregatibacter actinomycetemcomitans]|uniref:inorganic phosphate transporter n=1 Tax=Aggregatibacter actinomycetemcomitans TaxID=714 RepID=UPI0011D87439|nr:inorganic phosphate transporter [Aggregatibacter actinomycetemcomitans]QEH45323.1 inorganic phosphate transporter [Aggregatibacter actinomycetemcomitans]QEH47826.1 inorganic phosphate transporter [Aggregatibacter actinomycetemcomitans]QEH49745.1 inorganic phosphate transporter [Aggregatibacter actinomycetemcomitans]TYA50176.1 inorganic phosphate transporter [Aggregatibacter actinomycetemcomitans]